MKTTRYKNHDLSFEESQNPALSIDGKPLEVGHDVEAAAYSSMALPYQTFSSVEELGKAIIDQKGE